MTDIMYMKTILENNLHPNAVISELSYTEESSIQSIVPERILIDSIELIPIFKANFTSVCDLYRYTDSEVFKHYGSTNHNFQQDTRKYVENKKEAWKNAEWFEYIIVYEDDYIGKTYLNASSKLDSYEIGYWLQKEYWGNEISQKLADGLIHISFELLDASYFDVGCVIQNVKSRKAIEKYVERYNGSFYGFVPRTNSVYHSQISSDPTRVVKHPEWVITQDNYLSEDTGISTTIPNIDYDDIEFDQNHYI